MKLIKVCLMERNETENIGEFIVKCITAKHIPENQVEFWLKEHNAKIDLYENRLWIKGC